jgi:hypothetical protein
MIFVPLSLAAIERERNDHREQAAKKSRLETGTRESRWYLPTEFKWY